MPKAKSKNFWWWLKTTAFGLATTAVSFAPELLQLFPEHTLMFKLAIPAGFFVKSLMTKKEYKKDVLPSGLTNMMDKVPNKYTGVRGSLAFKKKHGNEN